MRYFDYSATTPPLAEVVRTVSEVMSDIYGNPSSLHRKGVEAEALLESDTDGLVVPHSEDVFRVTEKGRAFLRSICACFDAYLGQGEVRHSVGV